MDVSDSMARRLNAVAWGLPAAVVLFLTASLDWYFPVNFAVGYAAPFAVLFVFTLLDLRQPEFVATAAAFLALLFWGVARGGEWWYGDLVLLPGFIAGTLLTLAWSRRHPASPKSVFIAVLAPYAGVAVEILLWKVEGRLGARVP